MQKRRFGTAIVALVLAVLLSLTCFADISVVEASDAFYVSDYADVLSTDTENYIVQTGSALCEATGAEFVVVTVDFLGGAEIEDYATKLFNSWKLGDPTKNNGLLLLLAIGEDNYWAMQGKGLESSLTSGTIGELLNQYLEPEFAEGNYDAGVRAVYDALCGKLEEIYGVTLDTSSSGGVTGTTPVPQQPESQKTSSGGGFLIVGLLFLILIFAALGMFARFLMRIGTPRPPRHYGGYYGVGRGPQMYRRRTPPPPMGEPRRPSGGMGGFGASRPSSGGFNSRTGGGMSRGGGAGRSSMGGFGGSRSSFGGGSSLGGGRTGGGGMSRGGGAGRR
jgi:uncharacterized protein